MFICRREAIHRTFVKQMYLYTKILNHSHCYVMLRNQKCMDGTWLTLSWNLSFPTLSVICLHRHVFTVPTDPFIYLHIIVFGPLFGEVRGVRAGLGVHRSWDKGRWFVFSFFKTLVLTLRKWGSGRLRKKSFTGKLKSVLLHKLRVDHCR